MKLFWTTVLVLCALAASATQGFAQVVEYVRVCDRYGANYFYSPGTETCINANTQETRRETELGIVTGQTAFAESVDKRIEAAFEASAISNALADPDLVAGEHFGIKVNWGGVEGANAFGVTGAMVFTEGLFEGGNGRLTGSGGVAFSGSTVGGRAGLQLTW